MIREKLTKQFLFTLPAGTYCGIPPVYRDTVVSTRDRDAQWKSIVMAGAAGRLCNVFDSEQAFMNSHLARAYGLRNELN